MFARTALAVLLMLTSLVFAPLFALLWGDAPSQAVVFVVNFTSGCTRGLYKNVEPSFQVFGQKACLDSVGRSRTISRFISRIHQVFKLPGHRSINPRDDINFRERIAEDQAAFVRLRDRNGEETEA